MTRPKKEKTLTKTKDVHLRMNETKYALLIERARASNMTVSEFVRNALNNQNVIIKYEITADVPEIKQLISQFGKIGNNMNQIARYLAKLKPFKNSVLDFLLTISTIKAVII